jgi:hypothetical protein
MGQDRGEEGRTGECLLLFLPRGPFSLLAAVATLTLTLRRRKRSKWEIWV